MARQKRARSCTLEAAIYPAVARLGGAQIIVGTWLSLVERTLGVGEVASSNLVVPTIYFQLITGGKCPKWVHGFEPGLVDLGCADSLVRST